MVQLQQYFKMIMMSFLLITTIISCSTTKNKFTQADRMRLDSLVQQKQFTIVSDWANPQASIAMQQIQSAGWLPPGSGVGNINLIGNPNFLTIKGDSISSYLPYFGEVRMSANYGGSSNAIAFKGTTKNYTVVKNKDASYNIQFDAKSNGEYFEVIIKLLPNLQSTIILNGLTRSFIRYEGSVDKNKPVATKNNTTP